MVSLAFFYRNIFRNAYPQRDSQRSMISNISLSLFFYPFYSLKKLIHFLLPEKKTTLPLSLIFQNTFFISLFFPLDPATEVTIFFLPLSKDISCLSELLCFKTLENNFTSINMSIFMKKGESNKKEQDIISCSFFVPNPLLNGRLKKGT